LAIFIRMLVPFVNQLIILLLFFFVVLTVLLLFLISDRVARFAGGLDHLGASFGRCGLLNIRLFVTGLLTISCARVRTQSFARLLHIGITPFVCKGGFGRSFVTIVYYGQV
jgi:hypothetical protein